MTIRHLFLAGVLTVLCCPAWAGDPEAGSGVLVTVFSDNLGMIAEGRALDLVKGAKEYSCPGVPSLIDPASVQLESVTAPGSVNVLEQRFVFDLADGDQLLRRFSGKTVLVTTRKGEAFEGTLMELQGGDVALKLADQGIRMIKSGAIGTVLLPAGEQKPVETPTLFFLLETGQAGKQDLMIRYLTRGMEWRADYVAKVDREDGKMELSGWASIENRSGASFENARLQLVAGSVHQEIPDPYRTGDSVMAIATEVRSKSAPGFQENPFAEYHLYTLKPTATLADRSVTRLPLFPPAEAKVRQEFSYDGQQDPDKVHVNLVFENKKSEGLGIPLPAGKVRVYKTAPNGSLVFTGEDRIDHVPEGEKVELFVGSAFELVGERSVLETRQIGNRSREETVQITLRSRKDGPVSVTVIEHPRGNWSFVGETPAVKKKEADRVEFDVKVPRKGEVTFQYKVLYNW
jgi:hypothetical protein